MSSIIANLLQSIFPSKGENSRLLCVGLDASGRTSWLYSLKLPGERIHSMPTIGFNVETIEHKGLNLTIWDVGGCDKIRPLWRHYFQNTDGLLCFVDANDHDRMDEVAAEIARLMGEEELRDAFCLVIANKQDLPNALSPLRVSERLRLPALMAGRMWSCLPGALYDKETTHAHVDWIVSAMRHRAQEPRPPRAPAGAAAAASSASAAASADGGGGGDGSGGSGGGGGGGGGGHQPGGEADVLERWLAVEDEPDEEFLRKLEDFTLDSWDHRTHLRLAWLYLTRLGRRQGLRRIHDSIRAFIARSPLTKRRNGTTYHETMTYFWAHMVHFAMASQKTPEGATPDFRLFLLLNPQLSNGGLFLHYYSKKLMLETPESRKQVVLPDKRPLPSIITDISDLSIKQQDTAGRPSPAAGGGGGSSLPSAAAAAPASSSRTSDAEFLDRFLSRTLDRWSHECLLRAIYCCLSGHGRKRGGEVALQGLQALQKGGFHLTINYFWLAMMTYTLAGEYRDALFAPREQVEGENAGEGAERRNAGGEVGAVLAEGSVEAEGEVPGSKKKQTEGGLESAEAAATKLAMQSGEDGGSSSAAVADAVAAAATAAAATGGSQQQRQERGEALAGTAPPQQRQQHRMSLPEWQDLLATGSYVSVKLRELVADEQKYLRYYSKKAIFSGAAAVLFAPPDKRNLPSTV